MAWTYFLESVESASLLESGLDQLPTAKSIPIVEEYSSLICLDFKSQPPRYGMMLQRLREDSIKESLILSMGDFRARISALQEMEKAWMASVADCFSRSSGCVARLSLDLSSWKTFQPLLLEGEQEWSGKLPPWGMTVGGVLYQLRPLVQDISGRDGSYWATPNTLDHLPPREGAAMEYCLHRGKPQENARRKRSGNLREQVAYPQMWPTPKASDYKRGDSPAERRRDSPDLRCTLNMEYGVKNRKINLKWLEWLMGYPIGYTELSPLVMPWYLAKRKKRSKS